MSDDIRAIFLCIDLIWPNLNLYLALASYLQGIFVITPVAFWQGFGLVVVSGLVSAADKATRVSFDL